jgi:hypothetical protein
MNKDEFLSLYDYLGKAAGSKLGKEVNDYAQATNQPIRTREISNPKFTGKVMLYTKEFLDNYFKDQEQKIELPF